MIREGRYAAIDIGTVTCRMLVADLAADGAFTELTKEYAITNLGIGVDATGLLRPDAMERVREAVARYVAIRDGFADAAHPITTVALATSAARDAKNADEFTAMLASLGVQLQVIPGSKEAALSFLGAASDFPGEDIMVVDIGGGSTELAIGKAGAAPRFSHSFDIGCRRLTERYLQSDPPTRDELDRARAWVHDTMAPYFESWRADGARIDRMIGVAGTATTVVSIREAMAVYDSARVHLAEVTGPELQDVARRLASVPLEERRVIVGLDPGRAPVIVAGMVILQEVLALAGLPAFTVSESDILRGMILSFARA